MKYNEQIIPATFSNLTSVVFVKYMGSALEITFSALLENSVNSFEFMLDSSYVIQSLKVDKEEIPYKRTGLQVLVTSLRPFNNLILSYSSLQNQGSLRLLPGIINFPKVTMGTQKISSEVVIESRFPFITNAEFVEGKLWINDLSSLVIADGAEEGERNLCFEIQGRSIQVTRRTSDLFEKVDFNNEVSLFLEYYYSLFDRPLNCRIVDIHNLQSNAISCKHLIFIDTRMCAKPLVFLYKYLFHEIIHQELGLTTVFVGKGRHWLLESFTEFLQLLFLKNRFGEDFLTRQLHYYNHLYETHIGEIKIAIADFETHMEENVFLALICGKGVLAFNELFRTQIIDMTTLKRVIASFDEYENLISLDLFIDILTKCAELDITDFLDRWIYSTSSLPLVELINKNM